MAKEFKGVWIPKAIYQDKALNPTDKLIMSDIFTLGEYYKSNETIALEVGVSRATASRAITNLIDKGYITKYFDGRNRRLKLTHQPNQIDSPGGSNSVSRKLKLTQLPAQIASLVYKIVYNLVYILVNILVKERLFIHFKKKNF